MTQAMVTQQHERELRVVRILIGLAVACVLAASLAGLILLIADPASGSTAEGALGFTAAVTGLSTAAFVIAAAIYAPVKNLWQYASRSLRSLIMAFVVVGIIVTIANLVQQAS